MTESKDQAPDPELEPEPDPEPGPARAGPRILRRIRGPMGSSAGVDDAVGQAFCAAFAAMSVRCWEPSRLPLTMS